MSESKMVVDLFGWELLFRSVQSVIEKKSDILVSLLHFVLVKYAKLQCMGVGEDKTPPDDVCGSELLPDGWNDGKNRYALRYLRNNQLYLLLAYHNDNILIINFLDVYAMNVSNITLDTEEVVKTIKGSITEMVPNVSELIYRYRNEVIEPVYSVTTKDVTTQTTDINVHNAFRMNETLFSTELRRSFQSLRPVYPEVRRSDLFPIAGGLRAAIFPQPFGNYFPDFRSRLQFNISIPNDMNANADHTMESDSADLDYE